MTPEGIAYIASSPVWGGALLAAGRQYIKEGRKEYDRQRGQSMRQEFQASQETHREA